MKAPGSAGGLLLSDDIENACELAMAVPDIRLLEQLRSHLHRRQYVIDRAYATLAKLLDQEDENSNQASERVFAEEERTNAIRKSMDQGDLARDAMTLDLRCPACGETNSYRVSGVVVAGDTDSQLPHLIEEEFPCASCGQEVEFEFTTMAVLALSAEMMLSQAASSMKQERKPLVRRLDIQLDGKVVPIAGGLQAMRQRLEADPTDARSWFRLANIFANLNRPRAALSSLEKANQHASHVLDITVSRAQLLANQGDENEALVLLSRELEQQSAWRFWGNLHMVGQQFVDL